MKVVIKNRFTGAVIISGDYDSVKDCLEKNRDMNLYREKLKTAPIIISGLKYTVIITPKKIRIGCEVQTIEEWQKHYRLIFKKHGEAEIAEQYKPFIDLAEKLRSEE